MNQPPTLRDVYEARKTIAPYLARTPLHYSAGLSRLFEAEIYLKHEEYHPLGAFKGRGGINFLAHLGEEERRTGSYYCFDWQPRPIHCKRVPDVRRPGVDCPSGERPKPS